MSPVPIDLDAIRHAQQAREVFLLYQPIVSLRDGRCFGAEALIRWQRNDSVVEASCLFPLIENTPLSGVLTSWVIDSVAEQLHEWFASNPDGSVSVNIPPELWGVAGWSASPPDPV